jgi:hypothetical protein
MRYYVIPSEKTWATLAPQVPGAGTEDLPSRDEAIARCKAHVAVELDAYDRLGFPLRIDRSEELIDWTLPWWLLPDWFVPASTGLVDAAVRRMREIAADVDRFLDGLAPEDWDRGPPGGWSIRRTLDHVAGGFEIGLRRLEPWSLEPDPAQAEAVAALADRIGGFSGRGFVTTHSGQNQEEGRVRWTPRKVVRVVRSFQEAWRSHIVEGGPAPTVPRPHADAEGDDDDPSPSELHSLVENDATLRVLANKEPRVRAIATWYRYYRDRLAVWPSDERERWARMGRAFEDRLRALDETDTALVRVAPNGVCETVRMELGLGISHVQEHLIQMRAAKG